MIRITHVLVVACAVGVAAAAATATGHLRPRSTTSVDSSTPAPSASGSTDDRRRSPGPRTALAVDAGTWRLLGGLAGADVALGLRDGGWIVLDRRESRIHRLDATLTPTASFGGPGDGPGELARPMHVALLGDSVVAVLDATGTRLDLLTPGGVFVDRHTLRVPGCAGGLNAGLVPDPGGALAAWGLCAHPAGVRWTAARVAMDGTVETLPRPDRDPGTPGALPLGRGLARWSGALRELRPDGCLVPVAPAGGELLCLPAGASVSAEAARPGADRDGRGLPPGVTLPSTLPPVVSVVHSTAGPVLTLVEATRPDGVRALLRSDGSLLELPAGLGAWPGPGGTLLVRELAAGPGVRLVRAP